MIGPLMLAVLGASPVLAANCDGAKWPLRWTSITASHSASSMLKLMRSRRMPALLTRTSSCAELVDRLVDQRLGARPTWRRCRRWRPRRRPRRDLVDDLLRRRRVGALAVVARRRGRSRRPRHLPREQQRVLAADAAPRAGDDRDLAVEVPHVHLLCVESTAVWQEMRCESLPGITGSEESDLDQIERGHLVLREPLRERSLVPPISCRSGPGSTSARYTRRIRCSSNGAPFLDLDGPGLRVDAQQLAEPAAEPGFLAAAAQRGGLGVLAELDAASGQCPRARPCRQRGEDLQSRSRSSASVHTTYAATPGASIGHCSSNCASRLSLNAAIPS